MLAPAPGTAVEPRRRRLVSAWHGTPKRTTGHARSVQPEHDGPGSAARRLRPASRGGGVPMSRLRTRVRTSATAASPNAAAPSWPSGWPPIPASPPRPRPGSCGWASSGQPRRPGLRPREGATKGADGNDARRRALLSEDGGSLELVSSFVKYDLGQVAASRAVEITLDHRANVRLLDAANLARYERGETYRYVGGQAVRSPLVLNAPSTGHWYVVIDLGGGAGTVRSSVRLLQPA